MPGISQYPIGLLSINEKEISSTELTKGKFFEKGKSGKMRMLFRWPAKIKSNPPLFVEFKHSARAEIDYKPLISTSNAN